MPAAPRSHTFRLEAATTYNRLCDASGVAFLNGDTFVAASDETQTKNGENRLQIYRLGTAEPVAHLNLNQHLNLDGQDNSEADIESAARIGNTVYWITSHGRDSEAKKHPNRQRFFATSTQDGKLKTTGIAYMDLLDELTKQNSELKAAHKAGLAPEEGGISIEGLCQGVGNTLWIGFRSPLAYSRALCCELSNPAEVLQGKKPKLAGFWTLNVGQRGIRDWIKSGNRWLILAGSSQDKDDFALYEWDGNKQNAPRLLGDVTQELEKIGLQGMHPESIAISPDGSIWLMADDGGLKLPEGKNKKLPEAQRRFRSVRVVLG